MPVMTSYVLDDDVMMLQGRISRFRGASELVTLENVVDWNSIRQKFFALAALKVAKKTMTSLQ